MVKRREPEEPVVEARSETYVVSGPHGVYDAKPGEEISLDPDVPETLRLLARGQIAVAPPDQSAVNSESDGELGERKSESRTDPSPS